MFPSPDSFCLAIGVTWPAWSAWQAMPAAAGNRKSRSRPTRLPKRPRSKLQKQGQAEQGKANEIVKQEVNGQEAEVLRTAYILLDAANGSNYLGHRVKAMKAVKDACTTLDKRILAKGSQSADRGNHAPGRNRRLCESEPKGGRRDHRTPDDRRRPTLPGRSVARSTPGCAGQEQPETACRQG